MTLNTSIIKQRLASVEWIRKDNEAQNIINGATSAELKSLDAEGVLRLYEALTMPPRFYSSHDAAAVKKLATHTQFQPVTRTPHFGVDLVKNARRGHPNIQSLLTPELITRIYAVESRRLSWYERIGIDGSTIGRGQLGQPAYTDVKNPANFKTTLELCLTKVFMARLLNEHVGKNASSLGFDLKTYKVIVPENYNNIYQYQLLEDFVVAAYLAIRIVSATKITRSLKDTLRFAVALYHGMREMVVAAQTATGDEINWAPIETKLIERGYTDEVAYVNEVVQ